MRKVKDIRRIKLIELRHTFCFTQKEFAQMLHVTQSAYAKYENGTRLPRKKVAINLVKFCTKRGLQYSLDELFM